MQQSETLTHGINHPPLCEHVFTEARGKGRSTEERRQVRGADTDLPARCCKLVDEQCTGGVCQGVKPVAPPHPNMQISCETHPQSLESDIPYISRAILGPLRHPKHDTNPSIKNEWTTLIVNNQGAGHAVMEQSKEEDDGAGWETT